MNLHSLYGMEWFAAVISKHTQQIVPLCRITNTYHDFE